MEIRNITTFNRHEINDDNIGKILKAIACKIINDLSFEDLKNIIEYNIIDPKKLNNLSDLEKEVFKYKILELNQQDKILLITKIITK